MATDDNDKKPAADDTDAAASASEPVTDDTAAEKVAVTTPAEKVAVTTPAEKVAVTEPHAAPVEEEHLVAEPDRVNVGIIGAITFAIVVATVGVVVGVQQFFSETIAGEVNKKVYVPEDPAKKELAAVEAARLGKYQWASQKDGIVRIPVARARELVLAEYGKMAAYQPGAAHAAPSASAPLDITDPGPAPSTTAETSASVAPSASVPGMPSGTPAPSGSVAPEASTLKPGMAPSTSASVPHKH